MLEKEAFPIVAAIGKFDYLLIRERGFHIYTDHRNLAILFNPLQFSSNLKRYTLDKVQRWTFRLSGLRYSIQHLAGLIFSLAGECLIYHLLMLIPSVSIALN